MVNMQFSVHTEWCEEKYQNITSERPLNICFNQPFPIALLI
jgi:hypothetical protein